MRGEMYSETRLYGGRMHERDLFGRFGTDDPGFGRTLEAIAEGRMERYTRFNEAIDQVKRFTDDDPANPRKDFLNDLRIEVMDRLGSESDGSVLAYGALGTPLDVLHGTDAFLSIDDRGRETIVTMDATLRDKRNAKADLLIGEIPDPHEGEAAYLKTIAELADRVTDLVRLRSRRTGTAG